MLKYIDRNALMEYANNSTVGIDANDIARFPGVDAVPVVRCKDCKHYGNDRLKRDCTEDKRYKPRVCFHGAYAKYRDPDWFCADGERRDGDADG